MCGCVFVYVCVCVCTLSRGRLFATPWTVTYQAPPSMGFFFRQEYWIELPFPPPGDLPNPETKPTFPAGPVLAGRFFTTEPLGKPVVKIPPVALALEGIWRSFD